MPHVEWLPDGFRYRFELRLLRLLPWVAELCVDHQRLVVTGPFVRREVAVREIRELEIYDDALEVELWGGARVRLPAPAPREQAWIVGRIREIRDDVQRFALELALQDADPVKHLSRLPTRRS